MSRKLTTDYVKSEIIKMGYIPDFDEYRGNSVKFTLLDNLGYKYYTNWADIKKNGKTLPFVKSNPYTIENIKLWLKLNNKPYELLSKEYVNNTSKLIWTCEKHDEFEYSWNHMQIYTGCRKCAIEESIIRMSTPWEEIEKIIYENFNDTIIILDNSKYESLHSKIYVKCAICGNEWWTEVNNLKYKHGCDHCARQKLSKMFRTDKNIIIEKVKYTLPYVDIVDDFSKYKNGRSKIKCYCNKHNIQFKQWVSLLLLGISCPECGLDKKRGENNCNWNPNLTNEERESRRQLTDENGMNHREWAKIIFKLDNYKCVICGNNGYLNAHHIKSWAKHKELRYELDNGVTLCKKCHSQTSDVGFHNIYGTRSFTDIDFYNFYKERTEKEFNIEEIRTKGIS